MRRLIPFWIVGFIAIYHVEHVRNGVALVPALIESALVGVALGSIVGALLISLFK